MCCIPDYPALSVVTWLDAAQDRSVPTDFRSTVTAERRLGQALP
nr:hypothetical protein JVH1_7298 [Rhodococcus sp. JVH1]